MTSVYEDNEGKSYIYAAEGEPCATELLWTDNFKWIDTSDKREWYAVYAWADMPEVPATL